MVAYEGGLRGALTPAEGDQPQYRGPPARRVDKIAPEEIDRRIISVVGGSVTTLMAQRGGSAYRLHFNYLVVSRTTFKTS